MATKKYGYNQYKPDGPAGMDIVDQELNRYSPAFDYLSGFVTRSKLKQVDDDRTGTPNTQPNGNQPNGNQPNGNQPNGNQPNSNQPNGNQPNGNQPNGNQPNGNQPNGNQPNGNQPNGNQPNGNQPNGNQPNGDQPNTRFSDDFATEADAKSYINTYYQDKLGRDANFGTTTDDTDASYWLKNFQSGADTKGSFDSNVLLGDEYKQREDLKTAYTDSGRAATEQELDAMMGTDTAANTANTTFLTDYATKLAATSDSSKSEAEKEAAKNVVLDTGVTKDATTGAYDTSGLSAAEATKFGNLSDPVKNVYAQNLTAGDLTKTTTQGGKQSSIDTAITDAYKLLGRKPDSEGYDYWAKQLKLDPTFDLAASFKESEEYKYKNPT